MSSTVLKLVALGLMLIDHIAQFIPGIPDWFHILGRLSAPLFLFCMVWGFHYTHDRRRYLWRMYLCGIGMGVLDIALNSIWAHPHTYAMNDIFVTLLVVGLLCAIIDTMRTDLKRGLLYLAAFIVVQVAGTFLCIWAQDAIPAVGITLLFGAVTANIIFNEASLVFVLFGVALYYVKENKLLLSILFTGYCLTYLIPTVVAGGWEAAIIDDYHWMMIASLPLMLAYNGKKGPGLKYFFYIFYPAHIIILFLMGNLCF